MLTAHCSMDSDMRLAVVAQMSVFLSTRDRFTKTKLLFRNIFKL